MSKQRLFDFMTMGDEGFSNTLLCSASSIKRLYPRSTVYIYDWGLEEDTKQKLREIGNVCIVDWKGPSRYDSSLLEGYKLTIEEFCKSNAPLRYILDYKLDHDFTAFERRKDYYMCQKPKCILDCIDRTDNPLVFLDGDAILIKSIDELFDMTFDVGVTLRPKIEFERRSNGQRPMFLNAGVIIFKSDPKKSKSFIEAWLSEIDEMEVFGLREQTALTKIIHESNKEIFEDYYKKGTLELNSDPVQIQVLPCERYNYYWVENGYDPTRNKILHFKAGKHKDEISKKVLEAIKRGDTTDWGWNTARNQAEHSLGQRN